MDGAIANVMREDRRRGERGAGWPVGEVERRSGALAPWRSREREAMGDLLRTVPWSVFCTWQFRARIGEDGVLRQVRWWLSLLSFAFGRDVGWMIGVEHDLGAEWPHAHGLVVGERLGAPVTLYAGKPHQKTVPLLEPFWLAWRERHGGGRFEVIEGDGLGCSFYCAKYAAKRGAVYFSANLERFRSGNPVRSGLSLFPGEVACG